MAYWYLQHGKNEKRNLLSTPYTYNDMIISKVLDKGIDPFKGKSLPKAGVPVRVIGGEKTPALESAAMIFAQKNAKNHIKKKTGASDKALDFWFDKD